MPHTAIPKKAKREKVLRSFAGRDAAAYEVLDPEDQVGGLSAVKKPKPIVGKPLPDKKALTTGTPLVTGADSPPDIPVVVSSEPSGDPVPAAAVTQEPSEDSPAVPTLATVAAPEEIDSTDVAVEPEPRVTAVAEDSEEISIPRTRRG